MRAYRCLAGDEVALYAGLFDDAKKWARESAPPDWDRPNYKVQEVEMPTAKADVIALLNRDPFAWGGHTVIREWKLTPRNALKLVE